MVFLVGAGLLTLFGLGAFGLIVAILGGIPLAFGVHRAARNFDSIAAVTYNESLRSEG